MNIRETIAILVTVLCLAIISSKTFACQDAVSNYNPAVCSGGNNGVYNCTGSRGLTTPFNSNSGVSSTNFSPVSTQSEGPVPTEGYHDANSGNPGGGAQPGTFDFRSGTMIRTGNGIVSAYQGSCPGVMRDNKIVYFDCNSEAMIRYAGGNRPRHNLAHRRSNGN